jgi:hypothetical protein
MQTNHAISGKLPKAIGGKSTVKVHGTDLKKGMLVTLVSGRPNSGQKVWVGTVKKQNKDGSWSAEIVALTKSNLSEIGEIRTTIGVLGNPIDVQDTGEILPLPPPQSPPTPPPS